MHAHRQSVTSEQIRESCGPTVCRCLSDFPVSFIHLQSPPEYVSPSVCLPPVSALLCLNHCTNRRTGTQRKHMQLLCYENPHKKKINLNAVITASPSPYDKSKITASLCSCKSLHSKHLSALDTVTLNTICSVQHQCMCVMCERQCVLNIRQEKNILDMNRKMAHVV